MTNFNCNCRSDCTGLAIVAALILGIITAFLQFTAVITLTPAFLWVVFGIAIVYLAIALAVSVGIRSAGIRDCVCRILPVLLTGILGTILTSLILLAIAFAAGSILGAIIAGALIAFFTLIVTAAACLTKCAAGCQSSHDAA